MRLHVDHRAEGGEALVGGGRVDLRLWPDGEEPAAVLGVEGPQRGCGADAVAQVLGLCQVEAGSVVAGQVDGAVVGASLPWSGATGAYSSVDRGDSSGTSIRGT